MAIAGILCSPVCQGQALDFLDSPCFNVPQGLHLENGCKCPCGKILLIQRVGRMNREERHISPSFDTSPVKEGSEEKTGSERVRDWPKVTQQVGERRAVRQS